MNVMLLKLTPERGKETAQPTGDLLEKAKIVVDFFRYRPPTPTVAWTPWWTTPWVRLFWCPPSLSSCALAQVNFAWALPWTTNNATDTSSPSSPPIEVHTLFNPWPQQDLHTWHHQVAHFNEPLILIPERFFWSFF